MRGAGPMTVAPLSLIEPDGRISRIRLSPKSFVVSVHNSFSPIRTK